MAEPEGGASLHKGLATQFLSCTVYPSCGAIPLPLFKQCTEPVVHLSTTTLHTRKLQQELQKGSFCAPYSPQDFTITEYFNTCVTTWSFRRSNMKKRFYQKVAALWNYFSTTFRLNLQPHCKDHQKNMAEILTKVQLLIEFVLYQWTATNREDRVVSHEGYNMTASVNPVHNYHYSLSNMTPHCHSKGCRYEPLAMFFVIAYQYLSVSIV